MGKMDMNNLLPPGIKPGTDQSNKTRTRQRKGRGRPSKYSFGKRPTTTLL